MNDIEYKYTSLLSPGLPIDIDSAVVALVRKPHGRNPEHAFILVERLNQFGNVSLSRYDFCVNDNEQGVVVVKSETTSSENAKEKLSTEFLGNAVIVGKAWAISKKDALALHQNVLQSQNEYANNPKAYNVLGNAASLPKSGDALRGISPSSAEKTSEWADSIFKKMMGEKHAIAKELAHATLLRPSGDSCFTWARNMLLSLNNPVIAKQLPFKPMDLLVSMSSTRLPGHEEHKTKWLPTCSMI